MENTKGHKRYQAYDKSFKKQKKTKNKNKELGLNNHVPD